METIALTLRQAAIVAFIRDFSKSEGFPPTLQEIAAHFGFVSNAAYKHVTALQRKGFLTRRAGTARSIVLKAPWGAPVVELAKAA